MADLLSAHEIAALTGLNVPDQLDNGRQQISQGQSSEAALAAKQDGDGIEVPDSADMLARSAMQDKSASEKARFQGQSHQHYNFAAQDHSLKKIQGALELIYHHLQQDYQQSLSKIFQHPISVDFTALSSQSFADFLSSQQIYCGYNTLNINPLSTHMYCVFDLELIQHGVELYYGAKHLSSNMMQRNFTPSEMKLMQQLVEIACKDMQAAWQLITPLSFDVLDAETQTQFLNDYSASELMCVAKFTVEVERHMGNFYVVTPMSSIESIKDELSQIESQESVKRDEAWSKQFKQNVLDSHLSLSAELPSVSLHVADVLGLKTGDVITLDNAQNIILKINGKPLLAGKVAEQQMQKVVQIDHWLQ